ncbi:MAG: DUF6516 family protein [Chloroflexota bacterium]
MIKPYLYRLYDTIISRGYIEIEFLIIDDQSGQRSAIEGRLRFQDDSLLDFDEAVLLRNQQVVKLRYAYHYQNRAGELIFRYDNAPHHPNILTYPHHKHVGSVVEASQAPDLSQVLNEIETLIFTDD